MSLLGLTMCRAKPMSLAAWQTTGSLVAVVFDVMLSGVAVTLPAKCMQAHLPVSLCIELLTYSLFVPPRQETNSKIVAYPRSMKLWSLISMVCQRAADCKQLRNITHKPQEPPHTHTHTHPRTHTHTHPQSCERKPTLYMHLWQPFLHRCSLSQKSIASLCR